MNPSIKILIADDIQLLLEDMTELINSQPDMDVVGTASNGKEIEELARHIDHDLILMDIEMETTTAGIKATERIREWCSEKKVIYLTAHETKEMILTAVGTGALDYIVKGTEDASILHHIRQAHLGQPIMDGMIQEIVLQEYRRLRQTESSLLYFITNISNLTNTEKVLISYLLKGLKIKEIARERGVEVVTIKSQINTLLKKFNVLRTSEIVKMIHNMNLTHLFI